MNFLNRPFKRPFSQRSVNANSSAASSSLNPSTTRQCVGTSNTGPSHAFSDGSLSLDSSESAGRASDLRQAFTVVWGTYKPGKKHKVWEDDAVLVRNGRLLILRDLSGKELDREYGFSASNVIVEGDILRLNGRECLIESVIDYNDYQSGTCFENSFNVKPFSESKPNVTYKGQNFKSTLVRSRYSRFSTPFETEQTLEELKAAEAKPLQMPTMGLKGERPVMVDQRLAAVLREHQREGVIHIYECMMGMRSCGQGCILADEMGLGKTLQCIACVYTLLRSGPMGRPVISNVLVLAPSSLVRNWKREFEKWLRNDRQLNVYAVDGRKNTISDFLRKRRNQFPILVVSYETFAKQYRRFGSFEFDMLVCDEAHRLKNGRTKIVQILSNELVTKRRLLLTGTPIQNHLQELYTLCDLANPNCFGTPAEFQRQYANPILKSREPDTSEEDYEASIVCIEKLTDLLRTFFLRRSQSTLNDYLPCKIEHVIVCKLGQVQRNIYQAVLDDQNTMSELRPLKQLHEALTQLNEAIEVPTSMPLFNQLLPYIAFLRKLCNHPLLVSQSYNEAHYSLSEQSLIRQLAPLIDPLLPLELQRVEQQGGKFSVLCEMLKQIMEHGCKVVVVSNFTQTLDLIGRHCYARKYPTLRLDGSTPAADRQTCVDKFNTMLSGAVFLLSSKAGGCGLNLVGASHLILYDIDWNPANDAQAMARIWRDGQKNTAHLYRLVTAGTIEERILQRQMVKQGLSSTIQDGRHISVNGTTRFSKEELRDIFSLRTDILSLTHESLGCECHKQNENDNSSQSPKPTDDTYEDSTLVDDQYATSELLDSFGSYDAGDEEEQSESPVIDLWTPSQQIQPAHVTDEDDLPIDDDWDDLYFTHKIPETECEDVSEPPEKRARNMDQDSRSDVNLSSLHNWDHFAFPFYNCELDKMLMLAKESINFVFRHVTNPQQPTSD